MKKIVLLRRRALLPAALATLLLTAPNLVAAPNRIERISIRKADIQVAGRVVDDKGAGIPGVTVLVKGTTNGASTDPDGRFSLLVPDNAVLTFSSIGFISQEIAVAGRTTVNLTLATDTKTLEEVVVTGYQQERRKDLTGAVAVVDVQQTLQESNANILTSLQGRVPGVVIQSDGTPGGSNTSVRIRGFSTIGNTGPLYVIDGVPTTYAGALNPNDIESIQVLKDAASASIYGSRASNGVIVVTTKRPTNAEPKVSFDAYYGVQTLRNRIDMLSAEQWGQVYWQAQRNSGITPPTHPQYGTGTSPVVPAFIDENQTIPAANTDWVDEVFDPSHIQSYNLGLSLGGPKARAFTSLNYISDKGIQKYTGYDRLALRVNSDYTIKNAITVGENLLVSRFNEVKANQLYDALLQHPLIPVYDNLGNFGGPTAGLGDKLNPLGQLYRNRDNAANNWRILGNVFAQVTLLQKLTLRSSFGVDYNNTSLRSFTPSFREGRFDIVDNFLTTSSGDGIIGTWSNTANYATTFGRDHQLDVLAGVEAIGARNQTFSATKKGFLLQNYDYAYLSAGTVTQAAEGGGSGYQLLSQFGRVNYTFRDKYLISGTLRRDGSSRFGRNNQYGVFPAASVGWRLSEEAFLKSLTFLDDLKLRGSWGRNGNQEIGDFTTLNFFRTSAEFGNYDLAGTNSASVPGYYTTQIGNPDLKWESNQQTNVGVDMAFFSNKLTLTADYFDKQTTGMLINPTLLAVNGQGAPPFINAGRMQNRGVEGLISYRGEVRDFSYSVDINASAYRNKVLSLGEGNEFFLGAEANRVVPGQPVSVFYGWQADGLFRSEEEVSGHAAQPGKGLGRIRYRDLNSDGVINDQDRTYIGSPHPTLQAGLNLSAQYKGFDLTVFANGTFGNKIYNSFAKQTDFTYFPFNFGQNTLDAWSAENPDSDVPALSLNNPNDELRASSYFVQDGSYVNLKSLVLGYTLPKNLTSKLGQSQVRVYVQGQNLFLITKYAGVDPEIGARGPLDLGIDSQVYPHARGINFGVNASF